MQCGKLTNSLSLQIYKISPSSLITKSTIDLTILDKRNNTTSRSHIIIFRRFGEMPSRFEEFASIASSNCPNKPHLNPTLRTDEDMTKLSK